jgi:hypothetical protein
MSTPPPGRQDSRVYLDVLFDDSESAISTFSPKLYQQIRVGVIPTGIKLAILHRARTYW